MGTHASPNVLLVVLDSVRAANCSLYGAARETTPYLSRLADESTVYTQARAPSNWSLPSHVSLFTGLDAHVHQVTVHDRLRTGHTVFEALAADGYATGLFSENGFLTGRDAGLADPFETVVGVPDDYDDRYDTTVLDPGPDGFYYADRALAWSAEVDGPWAACLNLMDAHRPFEPREAYDRWGDDRARTIQSDLPIRWEWAFYGGDRPCWQLGALESLYDGGIRQADAVLEHALESLRSRGELDETLVVVCGDHGDGFGEPGRVPGEPPAVSHILPMHEELLHVPLVVRPPGGATGERVDELAALTRFPAVARAHARGDPPSRGFTVDRALALKQPVTADLRERFERRCDPVEPYLEPSRAVYENAPDTPGAVRKRSYWGDRGVTTIVHAPGVVEHREPIEPETVDRAFRDGDDDRDGDADPAHDDRDPVREPLAGRQPDADVEAQLAALGYY
jgi:arylsulfatase A